VKIFGENWARLYDLPMEEKHDSKSIDKSGRKCFNSRQVKVTLPNMMLSDDNNLNDCLPDKQDSLTSLYSDESQEQTSTDTSLILPSRVSTGEGLKNYPMIVESPILFRPSASISCQMADLYRDGGETSYLDLYDDNAEMFGDYSDFKINSPFEIGFFE
jgi:hypothetical protein